jgi:hypothetical protein
MLEDFQARRWLILSKGMVLLMLLAPEKALLLNDPSATRTVGGRSRRVKEM